MLIYVPAEYFLEFVLRDELAKIGDEKRGAGSRRVRRRPGRMARHSSPRRAQRGRGEHTCTQRQGGLRMASAVN